MSKGSKGLAQKQNRWFLLVNIVFFLTVALSLGVSYLTENNSRVLEGSLGFLGLALSTLSMVGVVLAVYTARAASILKRAVLVAYGLVFTYLLVGGVWMVVVSGIGFLG